ncbi:GNAT family N-acetyltransferase [Streptomyces sp. WI04-05B]|uniref:GNAT family N-acetyltransferase n=1 Tax=Streptomyces TaxID=1883 RepID=UPI0029B74CCC|nr:MULTISPECIES: GNAT family N-acetyltransferase [unclassified Streptomyces]MDX2544866.1 GNAT family N-acetyltransferase [Streptomyces sp. WI04-05B]MDX2588914.1 GNAT family N-acetyltransferase [Streptomyces sp. WI04-05A]MDX3750767.1 GNAT family N-acetyltransferase [Streptomyces sp. AK08-02]
MTPRADIDIRAVTEDGLREWTRALQVGFLRSPEVTDAGLEANRGAFRPGRSLGAFDGERCVATFRSFPQELSVGGGATVPADAVSNVTVSPTHRRRGILTRMMARDLAAAKERGDVVATLIAAEYPIYGRYGFGPATSTSEWTIDVPRAGLDPRWAGPADGGRIDLVDAADVRKLGPELHARLARQQPGAVSRDERWWQLNTGVVRYGETWDEPFYAVHRSADGQVDGLVSYESDDKWDGKQPHDTADVNWLIATTPGAERALWQYLCSIDWITKVKTGWRAPDDLLPFFLPDPRAARLTTHADWLWVRLLDVVRALEARPYDGHEGGAGGRGLVLEVVDEAGFAGGRYRLEVSPQGVGSCTPGVRESAELTLDVRELAALWLGDESAVRLAALGRVREERAGAARVADALLRTSRRPWCPDIF